MSHMKYLSKCPYSKKSVLPRRTPDCAPVGFILIFHANFHTNVWVFANLPIYKKLNHDNISQMFYMRYKIVCTQKYLHQKLDIYIIFIYKYWHYNLCQCYFEENKNYLYSYLVALFQKFPKDIVPIVPISVITSILLKSHRLSTIPEQFRIGSQSRKCQKMIEWKQRIQKLRRFDVETTYKN